MQQCVEAWKLRGEAEGAGLESHKLTAVGDFSTVLSRGVLPPSTSGLDVQPLVRFLDE
jgi:hypothetical protein